MPVKTLALDLEHKSGLPSPVYSSVKASSSQNTQVFARLSEELIKYKILKKN